MAFKAPDYPDTITKATWDKKKGLLAKAAGETGVGAAAAKAEGSFKKIDWKLFDVIALAPTGTLDKDLAKVEAIKTDYMAEYGSTVKTAIADLLALKKKAGEAAVTFTNAKTIPKASVKVAEAIADAAGDFAGSLALNGSVMSPVVKEWDAFHAMILKNRKTRDDNLAKTKVFLVGLLKGLAKLKANPNLDVWDTDVQPLGRSVSNNLKGNPELAKKYLKNWTTTFQGFDKSVLGLTKLSPDQLPAAFAKITADVKVQAQAMSADL